MSDILDRLREIEQGEYDAKSLIKTARDAVAELVRLRGQEERTFVSITCEQGEACRGCREPDCPRRIVDPVPAGDDRRVMARLIQIMACCLSENRRPTPAEHEEASQLHNEWLLLSTKREDAAPGRYILPGTEIEVVADPETIASLRERDATLSIDAARKDERRVVEKQVAEHLRALAVNLTLRPQTAGALERAAEDIEASRYEKIVVPNRALNGPDLEDGSSGG